MRRTFPESSSFHVTILSNNGEKITQEGNLEATPTSLVYTDNRSSLANRTWLLQDLQKCETKNKNLLLLETRNPEMSKYMFSTTNAKQLEEIVCRRLKESQTQTAASDWTRLSTSSSVSSDDSKTVQHWRLNTSVSSTDSSSSTNQSPSSSRCSSIVKDSLFYVDRIIQETGTVEKGTLELLNSTIIFTEAASNLSYSWPIVYLRQYGSENNRFIIEVGRKCPGGPGTFIFKTPRAHEICTALKHLSGNLEEQQQQTPPSPSPMELRKQSQPLPPLPTSTSSSSPPYTTDSSPPHSGISLLSPPPTHWSPHQSSLSVPPPLPSVPPPSQPPLPPLPPQSSHTHHHHLNSPPLLRQTRHHSPLHTSAASSSAIHSGNGGISAPFFRTPDSNMRRAFSAMDIRKDVFEVCNISDEGKEVGRGILEVTTTDLLYIDSRTNEKWRWPFKFLRKYGYENHVFSFEAGRRCPGGEGLYAFASTRAHEIHEAIVDSIQGRKHSPVNVEQEPPHLTNPRLSLGGGLPPILLNRNPYTVDNSGSFSPKISPPAILKKSQQQMLSSSSSSIPPPRATTPMTTPTVALQKEARSHRSVSSPPPLQSSSSPSPSDVSSPVFLMLKGDHIPPPPNVAALAKSAKSPFPSVVSPQQQQQQQQSKSARRQHQYEVPEVGVQRSNNTSTIEDTQEDGISKKDVLSSLTTESESRTVNSHVTNGDNLTNQIHNSSEKEKRKKSIPKASPTKRKQGGSFLGWLKSRSAQSSGEGEDVDFGKSSGKKLSKKNKNKKKGGSKMSGETGDSRANLSGDETVSTSSTLYENLLDVNLGMKKFSASCDNLLEMIDNDSTDSPSFVPGPSLRHVNSSSQTPPPPATTRPLSASDLPHPPLPPSVYANVEIPPQGGVPTVSTPVNSHAPSPVYSNISLSKDRNPSLILPDSSPQMPEVMSPPPPPPKNEAPAPPAMNYVVIDIPTHRRNDNKRPRVTKQSSLTTFKLESPAAASNNDRKRSGSLIPTRTGGSDADLGEVQYAALDHIVMDGLALAQRDRSDAKQFESVLERHQIREDEMKRKHLI